MTNHRNGERISCFQRIYVPARITHFHIHAAITRIAVLEQQMKFIFPAKCRQYGLQTEFLRDGQHTVYESSADHVPYAELFDPGKLPQGIKAVSPEGCFKDLQTADELPGFIFLWRIKDLFRGSLFIDDPLIHEEYPIRYFPGETHLMGDNHHGHPFSGEPANDREHLPDHGWIQSRGRFIKKKDLRIHRNGPDYGNPLLLSAGKMFGKSKRLVSQSNHLQKLHTFFNRFLLASF